MGFSNIKERGQCQTRHFKSLYADKKLCSLFRIIDQVQHFSLENLIKTIQAWYRRTLKVLKNLQKNCVQYFEEHNIFKLSPTGIISKKVTPYKCNEGEQADA